MIDLVHVGEVVVGAHAMQGHHAAHRGAEAQIIVLLDLARFRRRHVQPVADELPDPRIDLLPQIDVMRVERVVEVEHPGVDMGEGAGWVHLQISIRCSRRRPGPQSSSSQQKHHGTAKRSVLPPLLISTTPKPVAANPRAGQSLCSLVSNLVSRVQSCLSPPQFSGLSFCLMARLSASTASAKLKICLGWPVTSGCRQVLGSMRYQPRLVTDLPSSVATAAITLCGVSLHQVSPLGDGVCTASTMVLKKFGEDTMSDGSPRLFRKAASAACVFGPSTSSLCVGVIWVKAAWVWPARHCRAAAMTKLSCATHSMSLPFCGMGEAP